MLRITRRINSLGCFLCLLLLMVPVLAAENAKNFDETAKGTTNGDIKVTTDPTSNNSGQQNELTTKKDSGTAQGIQFKNSNDIGVSYILKIVFSLFFVLVIAYLAILFVKKLNTGWLINKNIHGQSINLVEQKRITPRLTVYVLAVGEERVLLAQSGDNVSFYPSPVAIKAGDNLHDSKAGE